MDLADVAKGDVNDFERGGGMRKNVDELLSEHKAAIEELRSAVADCLPKNDAFYDEIFLLRFVLTWEKKGGLAESSKAVRETVAWRTEHAEALAHTVRTGKAPGEEIMDKFNTAGYAGTLGGVEPLFIVRTGFCNLKGLMNACSMEEVARLATFSKEVAFQQCDAKTRKTRQLVKMISIIDLEGFSMFGGDSRFHKALGESSKQAAVYYPQLLGKTVLISERSSPLLPPPHATILRAGCYRGVRCVCSTLTTATCLLAVTTAADPPSYLRIIFSAFSVFMPKSALEKVAVCPATGTSLPGAASPETCPFLQRWNAALGDLPPFLGGTMPLPVELRPREELASALTRVTVSNRSSTTVDLEAPGGGFEAHWELIMQDYGIIMGATLLPADGGAAVVLMEPRKFKDSAGLVSGDFAIPAAGRLQVTFDNRYSMLRSKTFDYHVEVKEGAADLAAAPDAAAAAEPLVPAASTATGAGAEESEGVSLLPDATTPQARAATAAAAEESGGGGEGEGGQKKQLGRAQVHEMVRIQLEIDGKVDPQSVSDDWIDQLFSEFDTDKSGLMDDREWDSLAKALDSRVAQLSSKR
jgi:hypothetical protein